MDFIRLIICAILISSVLIKCMISYPKNNTVEVESEQNLITVRCKDKTYHGYYLDDGDREATIKPVWRLYRLGEGKPIIFNSEGCIVSGRSGWYSDWQNSLN